MTRLGWLVVPAFACGDVTSAKPDAQTSGDAPVVIDARSIDAPPPRCNTNAPFGAPVALDSINSTAGDGGAHVTPDELAVYFDSTRTGGAGDFDVYVATRATKTDPFGAPSLVAGVNTAALQGWPSITGDGLSLYIIVDTASTNRDIALAQRGSTSVNFGAASPVASLNSTVLDSHPYMLPDHSAMYLVSTRDGADYDVYRFARNAGGTFDPPTAIAPINSATDEWTPAVTPDELTIVFGSNRTGALGGFDIYMAKRTTASDGFGAPEHLTSVSSNVNEFPSSISADGCVLYMMREVTGRSYDIFVATRP